MRSSAWRSFSRLAVRDSLVRSRRAAVKNRRNNPSTVINVAIVASIRLGSCTPSPARSQVMAPLNSVGARRMAGTKRRSRTPPGPLENTRLITRPAGRSNSRPVAIRSSATAVGAATPVTVAREDL
jgi:hypothetical protein